MRDWAKIMASVTLPMTATRSALSVIDSVTQSEADSVRPIGDEGGDDEARRRQQIGRDVEIADQPLPGEQPHAQRQSRNRVADEVVATHGTPLSSIFGG